MEHDVTAWPSASGVGACGRSSIEECGDVQGKKMVGTKTNPFSSIDLIFVHGGVQNGIARTCKTARRLHFGVYWRYVNLQFWG